MSPRLSGVALAAFALLAIASRSARADDGSGTSELPAVIDEIRIQSTPGLWHTKTKVILRELPWKAGDRVTPDAWELGLARLWNTQLFSQIDARIIHDKGKRVALFVLEERVTLNPLFKFEAANNPTQSIPPVWWFHIGASDPNLFGDFLEAGALYEMFGNNPGGDLWFHNPRLFDKRLDGWFELSYLPRPRPSFTTFRGTARAQVFYEINDDLVVLGRVDGILDRFIPPSPGSQAFPAGEPPIPRPSAGALVSGSIRFGRVDTIRLLQKRWSLEIQPLGGFTSDPTHPSFVQGWLQFLGFIPVANRWNFALRIQGGITSPAPVQDLWYIGGLDLVRGLIDNAITTNAYALFNAEVRFVAFDSTWFAIMPAVFVDGVVAAANPVGPDLPGFGEYPQRALSFGAGARFLIPRFVGTGLRLDGAWVVGQWGWPQYSIGVYQFF